MPEHNSASFNDDIKGSGFLESANSAATSLIISAYFRPGFSFLIRSIFCFKKVWYLANPSFFRGEPSGTVVKEDGFAGVLIARGVGRV